MVVNNAESYIACCRAGLGLMQIPRYDVQHLLDAGELVEVLPGYRAASMPIALIYPHRRQRSRRLAVFHEWFESLLQPHHGALIAHLALYFCLITLIIQAVRPSASA